MLHLNADESRVLGVLVEKAHTTPQQYPLTLNALINGCNQKNNRDPITNLDEDDVLAAIDGLRSKSLAREAMLSGSRVAKYRHNAREALAIETPELVVLTELLLRGPQTVGELRGRASRMHNLDTMEQVQEILSRLMQRDEPMVEELGAEPGSRARKFAQLLCPELRPASAAAAAPHGRTAVSPRETSDLEHRVRELEQQVAQLRHLLRQLQSQAGGSMHHAAD
jgi:hypothetical protein